MHAIETHGNQAAFVSARLSAWHRLGTVLPDTFTAAQAMEKAYLGAWQVRKLPVPPIYDEVTGTWLETDQDFLVARTNPFTKQVERMGRVGTDYEVIQNEQHAAFLDTLVGESGAHFETAGSLNGGKRMFITMKMPNHMLIGGHDRIDWYLAATNSHDGTSPFTVFATPTRVVCQNTLNAALRGAKHMVKIRHTKSATERVQKAREVLGLTFKYSEAFEAQANKMIETELTNQEFDKIIAALFPVTGTTTRAKNNAQRKRDSMLTLFKDAGTQANCRNTAWGAYNAVVEHLDFKSRVQGDDKDTARANKVLTDAETIKLKNRAFDLLSV